MQAQRLFPLPLDRFGEDDLAVARTVAEWADRAVLGPRASAKEGYDALLRRAYRDLLGEIGLAGALVPEALGGAGRDRPDAAHAVALAAEEVGRADMGLAFSLACSQAVTAVAMFGQAPPSRKERLAELLLGPAASSEVALVMPAFAVAPADPAARTLEGRLPQARARREGGHLVLEATGARPLHAGAVASHFGIVCDVEGTSPVLCLVAADTPGGRVEPGLLQTGLTASPNATLSLEGARVDASQVAAEGEEELRALHTWLRLLVSAGAVGALRTVHAILGDWGEHRVIKGRGQIFRENPLCASLMSEVASRLHASRLLVHDLAEFLAHPETYGPAGAEPVHVSGVNVSWAVLDWAETATGRAMELMASAGYAREWFLERYWRDLKCARGLLGGSVLGRLAVARHAYQCQTL